MYLFVRGVRKGYLWKKVKYFKVVDRGWKGIVREFVVKMLDGGLNFIRICGVGGFGGMFYWNGIFEYYISELIVMNDFKGVGVFLMVVVEIFWI